MPNMPLNFHDVTRIEVTRTKSFGVGKSANEPFASREILLHGAEGERPMILHVYGPVEGLPVEVCEPAVTVTAP